MIDLRQLSSLDIEFLQKANALYTCDFRSIGESLEYEIPVMRKYENLLPWVLDDQHAVVNEWGGQLAFPVSNKLLILANDNDPRVSIYHRLRKEHFLENKLSQMWVAIPHPEADRQAQRSSVALNYNYKDFLWRNDKIKQKELLKERTPGWKIVNNLRQIDDLIHQKAQGFIKRRIGSGGFTIFDVAKVKNDKKFNQLFSENKQDWYFEKYVQGKSYSVQCVKYANVEDISIFGFSEQIIEDEKYFIGSHILSLGQLSYQVLTGLKDGLQSILPLLESYEGFFGIDFIQDEDNHVQILEANIRMTAVTVPTLIINSLGGKPAEYYEDVPLKELKSTDTVLSVDEVSRAADTVRVL